MTQPHPPLAMTQAATTGVRAISWPALVALAVLVCAGLLAPAPYLLRDADTYWHLAAGRWIVDHLRVPDVDPFSHSMPGATWTAHEWLAEVVMIQAHRLGSWGGLVLMTALIYALTLARMMRYLVMRLEPVHALLLTVFAAVMTFGHLLARPHVLAWALLVVWLVEIVEASENRRLPPWWLLGVMVVWANLHGSFLLGLALAGGLAAEAVWVLDRSERKTAALRWATFLLAALAAAMCTPSGWHGLTFGFKVMQMSFSLSIIGEWLSPNFQRPQPLEFWMLLVLAVAFSGRVRLPWLRALMILGLLHLALKHQRNVAILGLVSPILLAAPLSRGWYTRSNEEDHASGLDRWFRCLAAPLSTTARAIWAIALVALAGGALHWRAYEPHPNFAPTAALAAARAEGVSGPVLNDYSFGGFLIYQGVPVHVDGRADMYGDPFIRRYYEALSLKDSAGLKALLDQHNIGWTMLQAGTPAAALLDTMPGWTRVHSDKLAIVHRRASASPR